MIIYTKEQVTQFIMSIQKRNHYKLLTWYLREHGHQYTIKDRKEFESLLDVYKGLLF